MHHSAHRHYQKKYPGGRVHSTEDALDVFCKEGRHRVAIRKTGAGIWVDAVDNDGYLLAEEEHCLSPLTGELFDRKGAPADEPEFDQVVEDGRVLSHRDVDAREKAAKAAKATAVAAQAAAAPAPASRRLRAPV